ncbi:MAG: rod shape-determining protein MreC [Prosthecobacter sp.]|jgi:hypothetical protein|nr:rod shape-determining protein MreC [Prosthecobacter sp.]
MNLSVSKSIPIVALLIAALLLSSLRAQTAFELQELNTTLQVAAQKIQALEAQLAAAKDKNEALAQSAAASNQEAQELKERYERLRSLLEGLGIAALESNREQTQDRLLSALGDLRLAESSRQKLADSLMELAEASLAFAKTVQSPDPVTGDRLQKALVKAEATLASATSRANDEVMPTSALQDTRVVSLKNELGIAVIGAGARDGIKPGMPFEIFREDKPIAKVLITEVRSSVSGAVVQELASATNPVRVGDRARVAINR